MGELGGDAGLAHEALGGLFAVGVEELEGDRALEVDLDGLVDDAEAAAAELLEEGELGEEEGSAAALAAVLLAFDVLRELVARAAGRADELDGVRLARKSPPPRKVNLK
jgi:hypothetical protein